MKVRKFKGIDDGREILEISTEETKIAVCFGEEAGSGDIAPKSNPMIEGLTTGEKSYDGVFIMRNPENCNVVDYCLKDVPIYMHQKMKNMYDTIMDFKESSKKENIKVLLDGRKILIKDIEVIFTVIDPANFNTSVVSFKDSKSGKNVVVSGDFKNYDDSYCHDKYKENMAIISHADLLFIEGKYLGKYGLEYSSGKELIEKIKNIMKFYKQVFVIQSQTDLIMALNMYEAGIKTKKIFIEDSLLANLATTANGSCPSPFTSKKVLTYIPLKLENASYEFKNDYIVPFYTTNATDKMKKGKYVMNITKNFVQDIQIFKKKNMIYDACVILGEWKGFAKEDNELEEFINILKSYDMDYYELYTHGAVNISTIQDMINRIKPQFVIPIDFSGENGVEQKIPDLKILNNNEEYNI